MVKMIGFVKFGKGCFKADSVVAIERGAGYTSVGSVLSPTTDNTITVYLESGTGLTERFKTDAVMERRFDEICEQVSDCIHSAHTPANEVG